jgi:hypothetical protein
MIKSRRLPYDRAYLVTRLKVHRSALVEPHAGVNWYTASTHRASKCPSRLPLAACKTRPIGRPLRSAKGLESNRKHPKWASQGALTEPRPRGAWLSDEGFCTLPVGLLLIAAGCTDGSLRVLRSTRGQAGRPTAEQAACHGWQPRGEWRSRNSSRAAAPVERRRDVRRQRRASTTGGTAGTGKRRTRGARPTTGAAALLVDPIRCAGTRRTRPLHGAAVDADALEQTTYREVLAREFDSVTPENVMKWPSIHPRREMVVRGCGRARRLRRGSRAAGPRPHAGAGTGNPGWLDERARDAFRDRSEITSHSRQTLPGSRRGGRRERGDHSRWPP